MTVTRWSGRVDGLAAPRPREAPQLLGLSNGEHLSLSGHPGKWSAWAFTRDVRTGGEQERHRHRIEDGDKC